MRPREKKKSGRRLKGLKTDHEHRGLPREVSIFGSKNEFSQRRTKRLSILQFVSKVGVPLGGGAEARFELPAVSHDRAEGTMHGLSLRLVSILM